MRGEGRDGDAGGEREMRAGIREQTAWFGALSAERSL